MSIARPTGARLLAPLLLLASALLAAGCGGSSSPAASSSTTTPTVAIQGGPGNFNPEQIYRRSASGVVTIISIFGGGGGGALLGAPSAGQGSGFVLNSKGEIVTDAHVVTSGSGGNLQKARAVYVEFTDQNRVPASIVGFDPFADVALIKVNPSGFSLHPLPLGDSDTLQVGQPVAAIGSPFGQEQSLSVGVVSALHRSVRSLTQFQIEGAIQTDAAINPGNSGGPMLDAAGRVIGINQQIETRSNANAGVGFAVPISDIKRSVAQLQATGKVAYAYLGVSTQALYPQLAKQLGLNTTYGGLIAKVVPNGPAAQAGLRGGNRNLTFQASRITAGGDVILSVNGQKVITPSDLARVIATFKPGDRVTLQVLRDGHTQNVQVTLGTRPSGAQG